jgi:hypothetical protein
MKGDRAVEIMREANRVGAVEANPDDELAFFYLTALGLLEPVPSTPGRFRVTPTGNMFLACRSELVA